MQEVTDAVDRRKRGLRKKSPRQRSDESDKDHHFRSGSFDVNVCMCLPCGSDIGQCLVALLCEVNIVAA